MIGTDPISGGLIESVARDGFAFVRAPEMRTILDRAGLRDWDAFARSWDDLGLDNYMADGGRYRKRRHAAFAVSADVITRKPHQPHYQSRDYNALNGGIARWFDPVTSETETSAAFGAILRCCRSVFNALSPTTRTWHVEVHQFRIEARHGEEGRPTPEGVHRDGVDYVLVLLVARVNIASGETSIHGPARNRLGSFTLIEPMDAALLDDHRVFHGVTPVEPLDPMHPGYRDVLVVTFRREKAQATE
jgi:hypothetical protein